MTLTPELSRELIQTIADTVGWTIEAHTKIMALEEALKKCEPNLYQCYEEKLVEIRKSPPLSVSLESLQALASRLAGL